MALQQRNFDPIVSAKSQLSNKNSGWSQKARESALDRLSNIGLPSHRDEYWKYTNPAELITEKPNYPYLKEGYYFYPGTKKVIPQKVLDRILFDTPKK